MRKFIHFLLFRPVLWIVENFSSAPDRTRVFASLTKLVEKIELSAGKQGFVIPFEEQTGRFIIFSDQHKGRKNGADDFLMAEKNYIAALEYYLKSDFYFISLGDSEELWENTVQQVIKANEPSFAIERKFAAKSAFSKIFGNHDLDWEIDPLAPVYLKQIYHLPIVALEGIVLETRIDSQPMKILCTHGHQGDMQSDGNWLSKFIVAKIWAPLQAYLKINPNTPAYDEHLKTEHNQVMYEWSAEQKNLVLITGHTHQPVFESLTHVERLHRKQKQTLYDQNPEWAEAVDLELSWNTRRGNPPRPDYRLMRPSYFNTGCCCYVDGDITGIEISEGKIRLIRWKVDGEVSSRSVLEERTLKAVWLDLNKVQR